MQSERFEFRVSYFKLLVWLLITLVPIAVVGLYSLSHSESSLSRMIGIHFASIAESTSAEVSQFIHDCVVDAGVIAIEPAIVGTVANANKGYAGMSEAAFNARVNGTEKIWNTPAANAIVDRILAAPASKLLRRHREIDRRLLRITVTDERGAVVAATHKTIDYFQGDEEFWQAIYARGRGAVNLTDVLYDEVTKSHYIGIGVPVLEEGTNRFLGAVDALVDISTLFPVVNRRQVGPSARTLLLKDDATVIAGPNISMAINVKSSEFAALRDAFGTLEGRQPGYLVADVEGGDRRMIGFADTGLKRDYRNLAWYVVVSQQEREALSPVRGIARMLSFLVLLALGTVTLSAVYFSTHRRVPMAGIDELHRQPPAPRPAE
jgi:hypothetical protein